MERGADRGSSVALQELRRLPADRPSRSVTLTGQASPNCRCWRCFVLWRSSGSMSWGVGGRL